VAEAAAYQDDEGSEAAGDVNWEFCAAD